MADYKKMYFLLFSAITDALTALDRNEKLRATDLLIKAQQDAEEIYINDDDAPLSIVDYLKKEEE